MASSDVDRGWAWLIVCSSFAMCFLTMGLPWASSGAYNVIFIKTFPESSAATVAWATSLTSAVSYIVGPVGSTLVSRYGLRLPALLGGSIAAAGFVISSFAPNVEFLIASFGVVTGVGIGLAHISGHSAIAHYFDKHLGLATGIATSGTGVGTFVCAPLVTFLEEIYGWRGSLLIMGGIMLNICVCGFIMRKHRRVTLRKSDGSLLDWTLFRLTRYRVLIVNNLCVAFGICIVYVHIMAFAFTAGYTDTESAMLMSSIGVASIVGRLALSMLTKMSCVNVCALYSICFILTGTFALFYPVSRDLYPVLVTLSIGFGFFTASYGSIMGILLVETVGVNRYANGYGYLLLVEGLGQMCGGPFAGFLYDLTGTYDASLYLGGAVTILGGVLPLFTLCCGADTEPEICVVEDEIALEEKFLPKSENLKCVIVTDIRNATKSIQDDG